jgi:hypothetical protein
MSRFGVVAIVIALGMIGGGVAHAALPHEHSHDGGIDASWIAAHSALRGEEKKLFLVADALMLLILSCVITRIFFRLPALARARRDRELEMLRTGVFAYRRFV